MVAAAAAAAAATASEQAASEQCTNGRSPRLEKAQPIADAAAAIAAARDCFLVVGTAAAVALVPYKAKEQTGSLAAAAVATHVELLCPMLSALGAVLPIHCVIDLPIRI